MPGLYCLTVALVCASACITHVGALFEVREDIATPPQAVFVDPKSFAVLGPNASFRNNSLDGGFNPTNTTPPFFQVFHPSFLTDVLGDNATIHQVASNATYMFASEAPIYVPETDELFFTSFSNITIGSPIENNKIGKISLAKVEAALASAGANGSVNVPVTELNLPDTVQMTNGGTGPYNGSLLVVTDGFGPLPPSVVLVNPKSPNNVTVLLDNFFGRQFNSIDDVKVHPTGKIFFTDLTYASDEGHFRPQPEMPRQVYMFDPIIGAVRVVADGFEECNGIAFTEDGNTAYISDTGSLGGTQEDPATLYAFDVDPVTHVFNNRRVFAYIDCGIPDGIQVDTNGNVYAGTGDGVQVFNPQGLLLGKFFLGTTSANMVFAGPGRLVILAETKIFVAISRLMGLN